jgi:ribonuclease Z
VEAGTLSKPRTPDCDLPKEIMRYDVLFHLVNGPEGDPCLYANFKYEKRALLFDLGDVHGLSARSLLKATHVFVSHAHVDHFIGFDHLLRLHLGRGKTLALFGPTGICGHVESRLRGYSWNLVRNYPHDFRLHVYEAGDAPRSAAAFRCQNGFEREPLDPLAALGDDPVILDEPGFRIESALLEHDIPCLAFALAEKSHINVDKVRLEALGLRVGPWVRRLKALVREGAPDDTAIQVLAADDAGPDPGQMTVGTLRDTLLRISAGRKIAYVTDTAFTRETRERIVRLASGADTFFCEAVFSEQDRTRAEARRHLTAAQAGLLAREAEAKRLVLFHFSPKYHSRLDTLYREAGEAFGKDAE